jgi:hypothetical protein
VITQAQPEYQDNHSQGLQVVLTGLDRAVHAFFRRVMAGRRQAIYASKAAPPGNGGAFGLDVEFICSLRVLTDRVSGAGPKAVAASGDGGGPGHVTADGAHVLPLSVVGRS